MWNLYIRFALIYFKVDVLLLIIWNILEDIFIELNWIWTHFRWFKFHLWQSHVEHKTIFCPCLLNSWHHFEKQITEFELQIMAQ